MTIPCSVLLLYSIAYIIGTFVGLYGVFKKSGQKSWKAFVPFYNLYVWIKVIERPLWWLLFYLVPYLNLFIFMLMIWKTYRLFNKTRYIELIPFCLFPFVFMPYVGFSTKEKFYSRSEVPEMALGFWHSTPISKRGKNNNKSNRCTKTKAREWTDDLIYAIIAAYIIRTFMFELYKIPTSSMEGSLMVGDYLVVSKMAYGPRIPQTPVAVPFVHHTLPLTKYAKSYSECIKFPFFRFPGSKKINRYDAFVFNYPDGDTVALERQSESYYAILRAIRKTFENPSEQDNYYFLDGEWHKYSELRKKYGSNYYPGKEYEVINQEYQIRYRPVDKRENYVKRCVALPGDVLEIKQAVLYINGTPAYQPEKSQLSYVVYSSGSNVSEKKLKELDINEEDIYPIGPTTNIFHLAPFQVKALKGLPYIVDVTPYLYEDTLYEPDIFPHDIRYRWNRDNFGPITIPQAGKTVEINDSTICLYARIIKNYEGNDLEIKNGKIFINGKQSNSYTFKMNYYWAMGDNRHNSLDSRYWGFVPQNHIVGKTSFAWLSLDKFKDWGEGKIRWKRMFRKIN